MTSEELTAELAHFCPDYQRKYRTLRDAAVAAGLEEEYDAWAMTDEGMDTFASMLGVHDHMSDNDIRRAQVAAERDMARRGRVQLRRGHLIDEDEL